jgi:uroporphyrinogen decarboxylase
MTPRERILAAIRHQPTDRCPTDIWAVEEVWARLYQHFGITDTLAVYERLGIDGIFHIRPPYIGPELRRTDEYWFNEWGMGYRRQAVQGGGYDEQVIFPLAQAETIADLDAFPWPSPDWYDYAQLPALAAQYPGRAIECGYTACFFYHNLLRGLETSLMDPLLQPDFTRALVQRLSDFFTEYHRRCFEAAPGLIDLTQVTDDFGSQAGLLISPRIFDQFYRWTMERAIELAHRHHILVFHHDDGDIRPLLPRLVALGIEVLNPLQWRCGDWDLAALKAHYGHTLCFHGGVDNQATLPFGTPAEVRAEVRRLKATLGGDGTGYILAPCHNLQGLTPLENILALYEAAQE